MVRMRRVSEVDRVRRCDGVRDIIEVVEKLCGDQGLGVEHVTCVLMRRNVHPLKFRQVLEVMVRGGEWVVEKGNDGVQLLRLKV